MLYKHSDQDGTITFAPAFQPTVQAQTLLQSAEWLLGQKEIIGKKHNPLIVGFHQIFAPWVVDDETAWCGSSQGVVLLQNGISPPGWDEGKKWLALRARYYLTIGQPVDLADIDENCWIVFARGRGRQPGPDVLDARGHVGMPVPGSISDGKILVRAGNQGNAYNDRPQRLSQLLGVRRAVA